MFLFYVFCIIFCSVQFFLLILPSLTALRKEQCNKGPRTHAGSQTLSHLHTHTHTHTPLHTTPHHTPTHTHTHTQIHPSTQTHAHTHTHTQTQRPMCHQWAQPSLKKTKGHKRP